MKNILIDKKTPKFLLNENHHLRVILEFLKNKKRPKILEFGVERGASTKAFVWFAEQFNGKVFSIDIKDCSKVTKSNRWYFLQSDDLNVNFILKHFKSIAETGVDLIYIDSNHEYDHISKLLNIWFKYLKLNGSFVIKNVDSHEFKRQKDTFNSINIDLVNDVIKKFYYNNKKQIIYNKYFGGNHFNIGGNGLANLQKMSNLFDEPILTQKNWTYNPIIKFLYPYLKKIKKFFNKNS